MIYILPPIFVNLRSNHTSLFSLSKNIIKINRCVIYAESSCKVPFSQIWPPFFLLYKPFSRNMLISPVTVSWKAVLLQIQLSARNGKILIILYLIEWDWFVCFSIMVLLGGGVLKFALPWCINLGWAHSSSMLLHKNLMQHITDPCVHDCFFQFLEGRDQSWFLFLSPAPRPGPDTLKALGKCPLNEWMNRWIISSPYYGRLWLLICNIGAQHGYVSTCRTSVSRRIRSWGCLGSVWELLVVRKISQMRKGMKERWSRRIEKRNSERNPICQTPFFLLPSSQIQDPLNSFEFLFVVHPHLLHFWSEELQFRMRSCKQVKNSS